MWWNFRNIRDFKYIKEIAIISVMFRLDTTPLVKYRTQKFDFI